MRKHANRQDQARLHLALALTQLRAVRPRQPRSQPAVAVGDRPKTTIRHVVPVRLSTDQVKLRCAACHTQMQARSPVKRDPKDGDYYPWAPYYPVLNPSTDEKLY